MSPGIYLDWNATTPPHPEVIEVMVEAARSSWGNPASVHAVGRHARNIVESLREELAKSLAVHARDVVLTSGGTEANNLALSQAPALVTSRLEHPSIVRAAEALEARGVQVRWLPVPASGRLDPESLNEPCVGLPPGSVVAIQAANHETGVQQPLEELAVIVHQQQLRLHVDAVQAFGKIEVPGLAVADSIAVAAHKIRGPKGIGAYAFRGKAPHPVLLGGAQERGLRPGTVDPVAAAGFRVALELCVRGPARYEQLRAMRDEFEASFSSRAQRNGAEPRLPHVSNLSFAGVRGDELVAALDLLGVRVSSGSACAAGTAEPSPVITAMLGRERARSAIRFSLGEETSRAELEQAKSLVFQALGSAAGESLA